MLPPGRMTSSLAFVEMRAAERWRSELAAWRIPDELLAAIDESPYTWPVDLWERRRRLSEQQPEPYTLELIRGLLPRHGELIDIGAGTGRASIPLAREGHRVIAVERDPGMAEALRSASNDLDIEVVEGTWPEAGTDLGDVDVVMSAHVAYDTPDIVPFLSAMVIHARRAVVLELSESHPWADLAPYYRELHNLDRPDGPTVDDLVAVIVESFGLHPHVTRWSRPSNMWYENWDELLGFMGPRLVLPRERWPELRKLLEPETVEEEGRLTSRDTVHELATVWWEV